MFSTDPIRYASLEAAVNDLRTMLPMLQHALRGMPLDKERRERLTGAIELLAKPENLRERLRPLVQPDGTLEFSFSEDAKRYIEQRNAKEKENGR